MYEIIIQRQAQRHFRRIPKNDADAIRERIDSLARNPWPRGIVKLRTKTDLWRVRQGDYRIVYSIDDNQKIITISDINHRKQVYKWL